MEKEKKIHSSFNYLDIMEALYSTHSIAQMMLRSTWELNCCILGLPVLEMTGKTTPVTGKTTPTTGKTSPVTGKTTPVEFIDHSTFGPIMCKWSNM